MVRALKIVTAQNATNDIHYQRGRNPYGAAPISSGGRIDPDRNRCRILLDKRIGTTSIQQRSLASKSKANDVIGKKQEMDRRDERIREEKRRLRAERKKEKASTKKGMQQLFNEGATKRFVSVVPGVPDNKCCRKCRNHDVDRPQHSRPSNCPNKACSCEKCESVNKSNKRAQAAIKKGSTGACTEGPMYFNVDKDKPMIKINKTLTVPIKSGKKHALLRIEIP